MSTPTVPDGPGTELAAAIGFLARNEGLLIEMEHSPAGRAAATIVRAYLAAQGVELDGDAPDFLDHETIGKVRREAARSTERNEFGAYIKTPVLRRIADLAERAVLARPAAGRDLTARDVAGAVNAWERGSYKRAVVEHLNGIARPAVARTDGQPPTKPNPLRTREDWRRAAREDAEAALQETLARSTYRTDGQPPAGCGLCSPKALRDDDPDLLTGYSGNDDGEEPAAPADDTAAPDWENMRERLHTEIGALVGVTPREQRTGDADGDLIARVRAAVLPSTATPPVATRDELNAVTTADQAVAAVAKLAEAWAHLRMDTPADQEAHDELVAASRKWAAQYWRERKAVASRLGRALS